MRLSVLIPCYNELDTIVEIVERARRVDLRLRVPKEYAAPIAGLPDTVRPMPRTGSRQAFAPNRRDGAQAGVATAIAAPSDCDETDDYDEIVIDKEIIIVDDGSTDGTRDLLSELAQLPCVHVHLHSRNMGKGAAVRTAIEKSTGDILLVQDADLEYDPREYPTLIQPIIEGRTSVVYGSRFLGGPRKTMFFHHMLGNKMLTLVANVLFDTILSDMETCYKVFTRPVAERLHLKSRGWGFDPEITAKILKRGYRIYEVPISYNGREFTEGKKISWRDGLTVLWTLLKYRFIE